MGMSYYGFGSVIQGRLAMALIDVWADHLHVLYTYRPRLLHEPVSKCLRECVPVSKCACSCVCVCE